MAKTKISEFSATPGNNTDIDGINIAEGCAPSGINDAIRELMSQLKDFQAGTAGDSFNGPVGTTTAAAGAFTTLSASGAVTLSGGTANGVAYLNGSKVLTTGSALTFDGTTLGMSNGGGVNIGGNVSLYGDANQTVIRGRTANGIIFQDQAGTGEWMRLTSTGLGIGTSSPAYKLDVSGNISWLPGVAGAPRGIMSGQSSDQSVTIGSLTNSPLNLITNATARVTVDSSGNLGLGVTPSAWNSARKAIQLPSFSLNSYSTTDADITQNGYVTSGGGYAYVNTGYASLYSTGSGAHKWFTAPSGTAGDAISFTQALTLTATVNLLLGGTTDPGGSNCLYIANRGSVPGTPTGGGVLYVESGALKYKGSSGTITTLAAA